MTGRVTRAERAEAARAVDEGGLFQTVVEALQHRDHRTDDEGRRDEDVPDGQAVDGALPVHAGRVADGVEELQERDPRDHGRDLQRRAEDGGNEGLELEIAAHDAERSRNADDARTERRHRCQRETDPQCDDLIVGDFQVPLNGRIVRGEADGPVELAALKGGPHHDDHRRQQEDVGQAAPEERQASSPEPGRQRSARQRPCRHRHAAVARGRRRSCGLSVHATTSLAVRSRRSR